MHCVRHCEPSVATARLFQVEAAFHESVPSACSVSGHIDVVWPIAMVAQYLFTHATCATGPLADFGMQDFTIGAN
jgi:hypothetical protein